MYPYRASATADGDADDDSTSLPVAKRVKGDHAQPAEKVRLFSLTYRCHAAEYWTGGCRLLRSTYRPEDSYRRDECTRNQESGGETRDEIPRRVSIQRRQFRRCAQAYQGFCLPLSYIGHCLYRYGCGRAKVVLSDFSALRALCATNFLMRRL